MAIPIFILERILQFVIQSTQAAFKGNTLLRKIDVSKIGPYTIRVTKRGYRGLDGGISQMIKIRKGGKTKEVWHVVIKAGEIIHKHLLK